MTRIGSKRLQLIFVGAALGIVVLNGVIAVLMSGSHGVFEYLTGEPGWSLSSQTSDQFVFAASNILYLLSFSTFFSFGRLGSTDNFGRAVVHVVVAAGLIVGLLALLRVGVTSRGSLIFTVIFSVTLLSLIGRQLSKKYPWRCLDLTRQGANGNGCSGLVFIDPPDYWSAETLLDGSEIDLAIVDSGPLKEDDERLNELVRLGVPFVDLEVFIEKTETRMMTASLTAELGLSSFGQNYLRVRRLLEILIALIIIIPSMIVVWVLSIFIRIQSPGSAFFVQERIGRVGRPFKLIKLRTMRPSTDPRLSFESENEDRITPLGKVARRWRIDELPQLWNILKGEMAFIGPRPEQPGFVAEYENHIPLYALRHRLRPGLTGWAQVNQGYAEGREQTALKLSYDLYYLKHASLWLDLLIIFKTFQFIFNGGRPLSNR